MPSSTAKKRSTRRNGKRGPANVEALLAAARRLVLERGENFTTQDLIKEADVALQTFYRHFGGKDQLLIAVMAEMITGHCESLEAQAATLDDPVERLRLYVTETVSVVNNGVGGGRFITSQHWRLQQSYPAELAAANRPFADLVQRELEAGRASGRLAPRTPERDAWIINQLVMAVFHYYSFASDEAPATVAEDVWQFCLAAVGGAPATRAPAKRSTSTRSKARR
jgi:AcrR family transcriptional regulator